MNTSSSTPTPTSTVNEMLAAINALAAKRWAFGWVAFSTGLMLLATGAFIGAAGAMWYCGAM